jgi:hypothetical protein
MADEAQELVDGFKKDELQVAAEVVGADVPAGANKTEIAEAIVSAQPSAQPVVVDGHSRRSGEHPTLGSFVNVVDGEHKGRYGAYVDTSQRDSTGYPTVVFVRTRDADNLLLEVPYEHVRPSGRNGGR